jgi:hypothetical protein
MKKGLKYCRPVSRVPLLAQTDGGGGGTEVPGGNFTSVKLTILLDALFLVEALTERAVLVSVQAPFKTYIPPGADTGGGTTTTT